MIVIQFKTSGLPLNLNNIEHYNVLVWSNDDNVNPFTKSLVEADSIFIPLTKRDIDKC